MSAVAVPDTTIGEALALLEHAGVRFSITEGLHLPENITYEEYVRVGAILGRLRDWTAWSIGSWLLFGEGRFSDRFEQAALATGRSESTLVDYARVAGRVAPSRRKATLTFSHHRAVASLDPAEQSEWLKSAEDAGWSAAELREHIAPIESRPVVNTGRCVDLARRLIREARPHGAGEHLVASELVDGFRSALGLS